jgi:hypothetical protein
MSPEDWGYLQKLLQSDLSDHLGEGTSSVLVVRQITWYQYDNPCPVRTAFPWPDFSLSNVTFRYAALTFASYSGTIASCQTRKYLGMFYKYAQEAISGSSLLEIVAASYPILLYDYMRGASFSKVFVHFKGICAALSSLQLESLSVAERRSLQSIWQGSLPALRRAYWTTYAATSRASEEELQILANIYSAFQDTSFMLYTDINQSEDFSRDLRSRLDTLECYLAFYWDYYLALRTQAASEISDESSLLSVETSIRDVVQLVYALALRQQPSAILITQAARIISTTINFLDYPDLVVPKDAKFEHVKAAFLYCWAKLVENTLLASTPCAGSLHSSLALLRLVNRILKTDDGWPWPLSHSLFWAGLNLMNNGCPSGTALVKLN